jgi:hypothetical protein
MVPKVPFVSNFMRNALVSFGFSNYFLSMTIFVSHSKTYNPLILTSNKGRGSQQKLSTVKVSTIDLAFFSVPNLLRCGTPLCGKVGTKNKDKFAGDLFLLGSFALFNVVFYNGGFLNNIGFVTKPTKCKNDNNLLKSTSHIALEKSKYYSRQLTYFCNSNLRKIFITTQFINLLIFRKYEPCRRHSHGLFFIFD